MALLKPSSSEAQDRKEYQDYLDYQDYQKYVAQQASPPAKAPAPTGGDQIEAGIQGFGQGALSGYAPQAQSALGALIPDPNESLDRKLKDQGFNIQQPEDTYLSRRDSFSARDKRLSDQSPGSYYGGMVGGAIASAPIYGAAAKGVGTLAKGAVGISQAAPVALAAGEVAPKIGLLKGAAQATAAGAVQGLIQNPGDTEGKISPFQVDERLQNAETGGLVGAVTHGTTKAVKAGIDALKAAPEKLKDYAAIKALKSAGAMLKDFRKASSRGNAEDLGKAMIENGLVEPGASFESVAEKASDLQQKAGKVIGQTYQEAADQVKNPEFLKSLSPEHQSLLESTALNPTQIADELESQVTKDFKGKAGGSQAVSRAQSELENLRMNGQGDDILKIQEFKKDLDHMINYDRDLASQPAAQKALKQVRDGLKDRIEARISALDEVLGKDSLKGLKDANKEYGTWSQISGIAKDRVNRETANNMFSLGDRMAGGAGMITGGLVGSHGGEDMEGGLKGAAAGAALGLLNKGARTYGNPLLTNAAYSVGNRLSGIPSAPLRAGSQALGSALARPGLLGATSARGLLAPKTKNQENKR